MTPEEAIQYALDGLMPEMPDHSHTMPARPEDIIRWLDKAGFVIVPRDTGEFKCVMDVNV